MSSAERIARNEAAFRDANEKIRARAAAIDDDPERRFPFLCECADRGCTQIVTLTLAEYEETRAEPERFIAVHGHESEDDTDGRVVVERPGYVIVEKVGRAAEVARELDPRQEV